MSGLLSSYATVLDVQVVLEREPLLNLRYRARFAGGERVIDEPQSAEWQRLMESRFGGLKDIEDIIGILFALDGTHLVADGSRYLTPAHILPEALTLDARRYGPNVDLSGNSIRRVYFSC